MCKPNIITARQYLMAYYNNISKMVARKPVRLT